MVSMSGDKLFQQQQRGGEQSPEETEQRDERGARDSEGGREEGDGENPDINLRGRGLSPLVAIQYKHRKYGRRNPEDAEHTEG